jgi:Ca2+-transporting ATPase
MTKAAEAMNLPAADAPEQPSSAQPWHALQTDQALERLQSDARGLSDDEASERLQQFGPNALPRARGGEAFRIFLRQFRDPLIYVLLGSTGLAMLTGKVVDGLVIFAVVILNAIIGFIQEYRANEAIKALSELVPFEATVMRNGQKRRLASIDLVPGDVVLLESGDKVPADMRLMATRGLRIEEAALTGESVPAEKDVAAVAEDAALGDRSGLAFSGTLVTAGTGTGVVVATGPTTELGRISRMLDEAKALETPLTQQLGMIGKIIAGAIMVISVLLFAVGLARGYPIADAILAAVAMAVAAIPEGLPAIVTIALAIGVRRMARRRAIIRKLPAVETLGSTTIICSDKTGTLTRNEMTVQELWTPDGAFRLSGIGYAPKGDLRDESGAPLSSIPKSVENLIAAGALCNDAVLRRTDDGWRIAGDPTEGALVVAAEKLGCSVSELHERWPRIDAVPFESERQYMATLHQDQEGEQRIIIKGAPEVILQRCSPQETEPAFFSESVMQAVKRIAGDGMRVLACAARTPNPPLERLDEEDTVDGFVFLGLQGMIDPARDEAIDAIKACRNAGITVKMITGDHKETARAIGEALGLVKGGAPAVAGSELAHLSSEELRRVAVDNNVFARVAPEHKLRLVQALQDEGHVVAMTGDGVNDAPALKQAAIGVAMGITGTSVSKEAADMVLTDDNFATIEAAVEEGRRVYDNLIKAFAFVLPTNLGLALILIVAVAFFPIRGGEPHLPMEAVQILWINLVAAVALALPLAMEAMEPNIMGRPPRRPDAPILSPFVITRTIIVAVLMAAGAIGLFLVQAAAAPEGSADTYAEAQTQAVTTVIMFQIFYLLNCRSLKDSFLKVGLWSNPWIYAGIGVVLVFHSAFIYLPFMNALFGSAPLSLQAWAEACAVGFLIMPLIAVEKWWRRRRDSLGA